MTKQPCGEHSQVLGSLTLSHLHAFGNRWIPDVLVIALFKLDVSVLESLHWPWGESDGKGAQRLLLAYLCS